MSSQNFENLLLKSLIEDLDTANGFPNSKNFSEFEKNFHNSSSSIKIRQRHFSSVSSATEHDFLQERHIECVFEFYIRN